MKLMDSRNAWTNTVNDRLDFEKQRLHGIDGLRGLAVLVVVLYHLEIPSAFEAGFLGVDVFFTISGFLITKLLLREKAINGSVDFCQFYYRRARRLLPAAIVMMCASFVITLFVAPDAVQKMLEDMPAAYFYGSNWWQIAVQQSYFEKMGRPPILQHLWSLAVEEQYYLIWPIFLFVLVRWRGVAGVAFVALVLSAASTCWMAWIFSALPEGSDPSRAYLGSDTHAMGLLIGSALACILHFFKETHLFLKSASGRAAGATLIQGVGLASLTILSAMVWKFNQATSLLYLGGFLATSVLSAFVILALNDRHGLLTVALGQQPLRWLGTRSYSIYLWHWPISLWIRNSPESGYESAVMTLIKVALTVIASEISYRLLERQWSRTIEGKVKDLVLFFPWGSVLLVIPAVVYVFIFCAVSIAPVQGDTLALAEGKAVKPLVLIREKMLPPPESPPEPLFEAVGPLPSVTLLSGVNTQSAPVTSAGVGNTGREVAVIGDSVMLGAKSYLLQALPGIFVDAVVGRQFSEGLKVASKLRERSLLHGTVVLHLGTNGYIAEGDFRALLRYLKDQRVIVINVHANRRWTGPNNEIIERVVKEWPNVFLVRWDEVSRDKASYFVKDGIHLTGEGIDAMIGALSNAAGLAIVKKPGAEDGDSSSRKVRRSRMDGLVTTELALPQPASSLVHVNAGPSEVDAGTGAVNKGDGLEGAKEPESK